MEEVEFGRYRLLEVIDEGGMGTVYRAHDTTMDRDVAIKVLPPELAAEPGYEQRFRRAAYIAAHLNNPNIVPIYDAGEIDGRLYLVMPVVDGVDVHSLLQQDGPMRPTLAVRITEQIAAALDAAHAAGVMHRNVTPKNILVTRDDFAYLVDFGIASATTDEELSQRGAVMGTWPYLAPEQFSLDEVTYRADIYSLACVLFECLTGQPPFVGDSLEQLMDAHVNSEPPKPSDVDSAIPVGFDEVIACGMAKGPDERYQSASDLAAAARVALTAASHPMADEALPFEQMDFGRYRLLEVIGEGAMGRVYRAHDAVMGRDVAIKVLPPALAGEPGYEERFRREALTAGRLASPNIIPIYDAGEIGGRLYLVMPVVNGIDVQSLLELHGPMSPALAVRVIEQVGAALDTAHEHGLVHRDVKPSNILMTRNESVYLIDFGIAHDSTASRLTRTNAPPGTWAYMAPERFRTGKPDSRGDVYSLACTLYECLTGKLPFQVDSLEQLPIAHLFSEPPRPSRVDPAIPVGFDEVVKRGMAKNADDRYQTGAELATAARLALTGHTVTTAVSTVTTPIDNILATQSDEPVADDDVMPVDGTDEQSEQSMQSETIPEPATSPPRHRRRLLAVAAVAGVILIGAVAAFLGPANRLLPWRDRASQIVLPFTGLDTPMDVAVDDQGDVYVTDTHNNRVLKLAVGSTNQTVLPFTGLASPLGIAVDDKGDVYVADYKNDRVLVLAAGSSTPTTLPFTGLKRPMGVAFYSTLAYGPDSDGVLYVVDSEHNQVVSELAGSTSQTEEPFTGLNNPGDVAVFKGGVYVTDTFNDRVLGMPHGAKTANRLPFGDLSSPFGVAVDTAGNVYVADSGDNVVMKLAKGMNAASAVPFEGLKEPHGLAVDSAGNVYVADTRNNRVLKLPAS